MEGERYDVLAELIYWKQVENASVTLDFTSPGAQERYNDLSKLDQKYSVTVHDVRGEESHYTLQHHGFQYVRHEVEEIRDWSNEDQVTEVLLSATEQLVKGV